MNTAEVIIWIEKNWKWIVNIGLLVITILLGIRSYRFQKRTGLREAIEQLDDMAVSDLAKFKPLVHSGNLLFPPRRAKIYFQLSVDSDGQSSSIPSSASQWVDDNDISLELVENLDGVSNIEIGDTTPTGLIVTTSSVNEIRCRNTVMRVFGELKSQYEKHQSRN